MLRGRSKRLARLFAHANHANIEAEHRRAQEKARRSLLDTVRISLTQLGIDPMSVKSVRHIEADLAEEEAAPPQRVAPSRRDDPRDVFFAKIDRMAERYRAQPAIDFDKASLMQVLAGALRRNRCATLCQPMRLPMTPRILLQTRCRNSKNRNFGTRPERHP